MAKFSNGYMDGYTAGAYLKTESSRIFKNACQVIQDCNAANAQGNSKTFVDKLSSYLRKRTNEIYLFFNDAQLQERSIFIKNLIPTVIRNNSMEQLNLLQEENIHRFKGVLTQRLYDILVARRTELQQGLNQDINQQRNLS